MWRGIVYDILILVFTPFLIWRYILKRRAAGFCRRLLSFSIEKQISSPIWLHAVSVGEVIALRGIVEFLRESFPSLPLIITTITSSGLKVAQANFSSLAKVMLLPLDLSFLSRRLVKALNPRIFIAVETEIWPNLFYFLQRNNTPIIIINGRISERSFINYQKVRVFLRDYFAMIDFVFAKDEISQRRFAALGVKKNKISVMGNIKFIKPSLNPNKLTQVRNICDSIRKDNQSLLLLAASTHSPEETMIIKIFSQLKTVFPSLKIIICPRHIERTGEILLAGEKLGWQAVRLSQNYSSAADIVVLDKMGELLYFYPQADIVLMGGSFVPIGGHNIIEPAFFGRPIVFGPHMDNFRDEAGLFTRNRAAWQVSSAQELREVLDKLIKDSSLRLRLGQKAKRIVEEEAKKLRDSLGQLKEWIE